MKQNLATLSKLVDLYKDVDLLTARPMGVYIIMHEVPRGDVISYVPYYIGSGDVAGRLMGHLEQYVSGLHTAIMITPETKSYGLSTSATINDLNDTELIHFPGHPNFNWKDGDKKTIQWVGGYLYYTWCSIEDSYLSVEGELIERLSSTYRLTNARNEAVSLRAKQKEKSYVDRATAIIEALKALELHE